MDISVEHGCDYYDYDFCFRFDFELKGLTVSQFIINMILHYCKSLCVHKMHPYLTSIITLGYTTIRYIHYKIIICLVICVITTFLFNEKCLLMPNAKPLLSKTVIVCTYTLLKSIFSVITYHVYMYNAFVLILSSPKLTTLSLICDFEASHVHSSIYINWNTFMIVCCTIIASPPFTGFDGKCILLNINSYVICYVSQQTKTLYRNNSIHILEIKIKGMPVCHKFSPCKLKTNDFTLFVSLVLIRESSVPFIIMKQYQLLLFDCIRFCTHVLCHLQPTCQYRIIHCGTIYFHMLVFSYEGMVLIIVHIIVTNVVHVHVQVMIHTHSHIQAFSYLSTTKPYLMLNNIIKLAVTILLKLIHANFCLESDMCPIYLNSFEHLLLKNIWRLIVLLELSTLCIILCHTTYVYHTTYVFMIWMLFMFTTQCFTLFYISITALFNNG